MSQEPSTRRDDHGENGLLGRARAGDRDALDALFAQELPRLRRWASGRLPRWARDILDTSDLIQETVLETFKRLDAFEPRGDTALQAYLRQALINRLRNQLRRVAGRPPHAAIASDWPDAGLSPLEATIGQETLDRYEAALDRLSPDQRDALISRIEFGMSYAEIASTLGRPSADAARMAVVRALERLTEEMARQRLEPRNCPAPPAAAPVRNPR